MRVDEVSVHAWQPSDVDFGVGSVSDHIGLGARAEQIRGDREMGRRMYVTRECRVVGGDAVDLIIELIDVDETPPP
jgi:hypothetical protein